MKKVLLGSTSALLAVVGLSAFISNHHRATAGWYSANSSTHVTKNGDYLIASFPNYDGTAQPLQGSGVGKICTTTTGIVCAAYFNASSVNVNDPNNGHLAFISGTAN